MIGVGDPPDGVSDGVVNGIHVLPSVLYCIGMLDPGTLLTWTT